MDKPVSGREILMRAKASAVAVTPQQVREMLPARSATLVDVREGDEWRAGHLPQAVHLPRGFLEIQAESKLPDKAAALVVYCAGGNRSPLAAMTLRDMGYSDVRYMSTGFSGWRDSGFEVVAPRNWTPAQRDRYSRHFVLPEVGEAGQQKISDGRVLVVGAGGLGSPVLYYLAAAGVGTLGVVDFDSVEENNLQRQIIHSTAKVGTNKALSAASTIEALNPDVTVKTWTERVTASNVEEIIGQFDMVVDATDNFDTRYLLNDTAYRQSKPYVYGSIYRFEGYSTVFWPEQGGPCYRCLYPEAPPAELAPT